MKQNSNVPKVTMTTNGYRLNKIAEQLHDAGLDGINISTETGIYLLNFLCRAWFRFCVINIDKVCFTPHAIIIKCKSSFVTTI